jgi:hypothetical protein
MALYLRGAKRLEAETTAFLYCWTHIPSKKWYVGSRTAIGCHPNDGYICSSKIVKDMIVKNPKEWKRDVLVVGSSDYILKLENSYLIMLDAKNDVMSFNRHNGDGKFTSTGISVSIQTKKKMSLSRIGVSKSEQHKKSISIALKDLQKTETHKQAIASKQSVRFYIFEDKKFQSSRQAAKFANVSQPTIIKWSKQNMNGWSYQLRENT